MAGGLDTGACRHPATIQLYHARMADTGDSVARQEKVAKIVRGNSFLSECEALMSQRASVGSDTRPRHRSPAILTSKMRPRRAPHSKWKLIFKFRKPIPNLICRF